MTWLTKFLRQMKDDELNVLMIHIDFIGDAVCLRKSDFYKLISGRFIGAEKRKLSQ